MTRREVFTQALNEMELYMRWYYRSIGVQKNEDIERMVLDRVNRFVGMWLETGEQKLECVEVRCEE